MKLKTLLILAAIAVLFGALAYYSAQKKKTFLMPAAIGSKVLPNLAINRVGKLIVTSPDGAVTVAKSKGKWVVASRFNYPANFDKVADTIRELSELKVGQTVNVNPSQLGAFNLVSPVPGGTNQPAHTAGTLVELRDEKDGLLASLLIGKGFRRSSSAPAMEMMMNSGGDPDGQYVQTFDGKVYLVARSLGRLTEPAKTWLADDFINLSPADLKEIIVSGPDRVPLKLIRAQNGDSFTLADLRAGEGDLEMTKVNQLTGALVRLGFDDVADPALPLKETGLDRPTVFRATTKAGLIYTLQLGNTLADDNFDRYLMISVTNEPDFEQQTADKPTKGTAGNEEQEPPEKKSAAEQAAELNGIFGSWIYVIKSYRAEPLLLTRDDLIKKPEPSKIEGSQTNLPFIKTEETGNAPASDRSAVPDKKIKK